MKVTANVTRSGGWWAIEVPQVPGVFTQAKRLEQVPAMVADAVALMEDIDPDAVEVTVTAMLDTRVQEDVDRALMLKHAAERAQEEASAQMRRAVADVVGDGLTVRDAATLLEISPQRVSQLARDREPTDA